MIKNLLEILVSMLVVLTVIAGSLIDKQISLEEEIQIKGHILNLLKLIADKLKLSGLGLQILTSQVVVNIIYKIVVDFLSRIINSYLKEIQNLK